MTQLPEKNTFLRTSIVGESFQAGAIPRNTNQIKKMNEYLEAAKTIRADIKDANAVSRLAALLRNPEQLAENGVFKAYCLLPFGPENDWDGQHSTSLALKRQWEFTVLFPAQQSLR